MAEIFLAALHRDEGFEKRVVLKRILPQFGSDPGFVQMFIDEAVVAARISHPNVVQVYDFGNVEGVYFIAMEYVDGVDLRRILAADGPRLSPAEIAAVGEGVARALAHAHNLRDDDGAPLNIVHRDVSPHNIMISRAGEAKLMDFGIAKAEARVSKTATGTIKGKVAYMAPEQGAGRTVDKRSDQFALGLVLWECASGERMFSGDSDLEVLQKVVRCEVRDLRDLAEVPEALADVIMRCLAADPDDRHDDLSAVADSLAAFRYSLGTTGAVDLGRLVDRVAPAQAAPRRTQALEEPSGASAASGWQEGDSSTESPTASAPPAAAAAETVEKIVDSQPLAPTAGTASAPRRVPVSRSSRRWWLWSAVAAGIIGLTAFGVVRWRAPGVLMARVEVTSAPPGARVLIDDRETGLITPAILPSQVRGQPLRLAVILDGYQRWEAEVTPSEFERVAATLVPSESPAAADLPAEPPEESAGSATSVGSEGEPAATTKKRRSKQRPREAPATGRLSLRSTGAWVDVYLHGRKLGTTPLSSVEVPAGKLRLRLVNPTAGIDQDLVVRVRPDADLRHTVSPR